VTVVHIKVVGRVQGVGFRWFVRDRAVRLDLAGWVCNVEGDGVEIAASGDSAALDDLVAAVQQGPPGARVTSVVELPGLPSASLTRPFSIRS
jgi:acylphosphatase